MERDGSEKVGRDMRWTEKINLDMFELTILYASVAYKFTGLISGGGREHAMVSSAGLGCADAAAMPRILPGLVAFSCKMEIKYPWGIRHALHALLTPWHLLIPHADA